MALFTNSEKAVLLDVSEAACDRLALLLKRLTWADVRSCALDDEEAHELMRAVGVFQSELAEAGFSWR